MLRSATTCLLLVGIASLSPALGQSIVLSNNTIPYAPGNAGAGVGIVTITGSLGQARKYALSLSGPDASKFRLSSTRIPSTLKIGPTSLPAGNYNFTIDAIR